MIISTILNNKNLTTRAANEGKAILSGAVKLALKWTKNEDGTFKANIKDKNYHDIDELYVNEKYYRMARFPNYDSNAKFFGRTSEKAISSERVTTWSNPIGGYLHALHKGKWGSKHYRIRGVNEKNELVFRGGWQENRAGGWDAEYRGGFHKKHLFIENIPEELDKPGEWFLNKETGELTVILYEGDNLENALIEGARQIELISFKGSKPVDALLFLTDELSFCGLKYLKENKIKIPGEVSVISFDDELILQLHTPTISAIWQPIQQMGEQAVKILIENIKNPSLARQEIVIDMELIIRESV